MLAATVSNQCIWKENCRKYEPSHEKPAFGVPTRFNTNRDRSVRVLTLKARNTKTAKFANTADPDETTHNEPSHLDLQCLPSSL